MPCTEMEKLLQGYLDGELDIAHALQVEAHLETCKGCSQFLANQHLLNQTLRSESLYYTAPARLEANLQRISQQAMQEESEKVEKNASVRQRPSFRQALRPAFFLPALTIITLVALLWWRWNPPAPQRVNLIAQEALDSHLRALATGHLADVLSSNQHTVKPWFAGKLDYSPPVENFESQGYLLLGGRLDYLNGRAVAGLTYQRFKHVIYLSIWPSTHTDAGDLQETRQGFHLHHWTQQGMEFWLVSDINPIELDSFATLYRARVSSASH